jgi:DNA invertase Pin-like site-specific DNA recombinase
MNYQNQIPICLFVRVSSLKQEFGRQVSELNKYAEKNGYLIVKTIATKISGNSNSDERVDLQNLLESASKGEFKKVIVTEVNRLGRKAKDIRSTIDKLHALGISIVFKNLSGIESLVDGKESFVTNIIIAIYSELAQEERRILIERINSGLAEAKRKGKTLGRKIGSSETQIEFLKKYSSLIKDIKNGISLNKCMKIHNVSKNTIIKVKRIIA